MKSVDRGDIVKIESVYYCVLSSAGYNNGCQSIICIPVGLKKADFLHEVDVTEFMKCDAMVDVCRIDTISFELEDIHVECSLSSERIKAIQSRVYALLGYEGFKEDSKKDENKVIG